MKLKGGEDRVKSLVICLRNRRISDNKPKSSFRDTCELICHGPNFDENKIRDSSEKRKCKDKETLMSLPINRSGG
jgi:hypothetical protein